MQNLNSYLLILKFVGVIIGVCLTKKVGRLVGMLHDLAKLVIVPIIC